MRSNFFPTWLGLLAGRIRRVFLWRRGPESNRAERICNPACAGCAASAYRASEFRQQRQTCPVCRAVSIFFPVCLAACGGGESSPPPACVPQPIAIQIEGDSISLGVGADPAFSPQALLAAAYPAATVIATGHSSSTTQDRIDGTNGYAPFPQGITGNVYITEFGVAAAARGEDLAVFKANLRRIASVPGAMLETPTPSTAFDMAPFAQAVREVAAELHVPVAEVNAYVLGLPNWQMLLVDGVHPSGALYRMIYSVVVVPAVAKQVTALRCQ